MTIRRLRPPVSVATGDPPEVDAHETTASPCAVCGGTTSEPIWWGPWRIHHRCRRLLGYPAGRVADAAHRLAIDATLTVEDAALLDVVVPPFHETGAAPVDQKTRLRWWWVDRKRLAKAHRRLPALRRRAGLDASVCRSGACAWCGVRRSHGWKTSPYRWRDGSQAPFCADCATVWQRHGRPEVGTGLAAALTERLTGVPPMLAEGEPPTLIPYLGRSDDRAGVVEPWAYADPAEVDRVRLERWGRYPNYAPPQRRAEAMAAFAASESGARERQAAEEAHRLPAFANRQRRIQE